MVKLHPILWSSLPVALHNVPSIVQSLGGQQNCPGVCDLEEVLGASHERALVPSGLLDVDVGGQLSSHGCFSLLWAETWDYGGY